MASTAERTTATSFLGSIIQQADSLRLQLDEMPTEMWAEMFSIIRQVDSLLDDALSLLDGEE